MQTDALFARWRERVEGTLQQCLPVADSPPDRLHAAMRHAVLGGGKRMRPLLVYASGMACGADEGALDAPAAAVELIHAYSLVHDDLPAMDDDDMRRGRPTVHVLYGEATGILVGDALQSLAFDVIASERALAPEARLAMVATLARAAGSHGMCGGQALDLAATGQGTREATRHRDGGGGDSEVMRALEQLHALKTGALIDASVRMGALASGTDQGRLDQLQYFSAALGLAFQIRDDILDVEGSVEQLGKTAGKDEAQDKTTFPALLGLEGSHRRLDALGAEMHEALAALGPEGDGLRALARLTIQRQH